MVTKTMKVIAWNVNGFRPRQHEINKLFSEEQPDVFLLYETRQSYQKSFEREGYRLFWNEGPKGRSGTCCYIKQTIKATVEDYMAETYPGRGQLIQINEFKILSVYAVNAGINLKTLDVKTQWNKDLSQYVVERNVNVVVGDLNVISKPQDVHNLRPNLAGCTPQERKDLADFLELHNFVDTFRQLHPTKTAYTYWSYRGGAKKNNKGWRLDYCLAKKDLLKRIQESDIIDVETKSDHAPILIILGK